MSRLFPRFAVPLLASLPLLGGCGPEELMDEPGPQPEASLATSTQDLVSNGSYSWIAPSMATPMGTTWDRACFLTRVQGRFDLWTDSVRVFATGGSWYLHGGGDTRASSRCALLNGGALSGEYEWVPSQSLPTNMGTASGRVCFLTRVAGDFNGWNYWVRVYVSGGSWFLFGSANKLHGTARARCVTVPTYSVEYSWSQGQSLGTHLGTTSGQVCALTYVAGEFASANEYVDIYASSGSWYLRGNSSTHGLTARARCF